MSSFELIISSAASIIRIIIYCYFGESITKQFKSLVKKVEVMSLSNTLSNDDWNQLNTIRNMNKQFTVDIFGLFLLRTTTTLAIGAFVLNYSVLLIQTDHNNNPCDSYKFGINGTSI
jgi:enolase